MLAVHVPAGAVRHKMAAEGLAEPDIEAFLVAHAGGGPDAGPECEAAPPAPYASQASAPTPAPGMAEHLRSIRSGVPLKAPAAEEAPAAPETPDAAAALLEAIRRGVALKPAAAASPPSKASGRPAPAAPTMQSLLARALGARRTDAHLLSGESAAFTRDDYSDT